MAAGAQLTYAPAARSRGQQKSLEDGLRKENNNFTLVRLLASLAVIFGHAYALTPGATEEDPLGRLLHFDYSGSLAVKLFFFLSGMMVTTSFVKDPRPFYFLIKRALRIFPALVVCTLVTVFLIGPILTDVSLGSYFSSGETWRYVFLNSTLYDLQWKLPGLFTSSPYGPNGSIWTLPLEWICYYLLAFLGDDQFFRSRTSAALFALAVIVVSLIFPKKLPWFGLNADAYLLPACFATGVLFGLYRRRIVISWRLCLALWAAFVFLALLGWVVYPFYIAFFYTVVAVATSPILLGKARTSVDVSYGVYLYGFPIQQSLYHLMPTMNVHANQALASLIAVGVGFLSWRLIERHAIDLGQRIGRRRVPPVFSHASDVAARAAAAA